MPAKSVNSIEFGRLDGDPFGIVTKFFPKLIPTPKVYADNELLECYFHFISLSDSQFEFRRQ